MINETNASSLAEIFAALSDASRLKIIAALADGEQLNVGQIAEKVGLSESATSHHLRSLRHLRLVRARKDGRQVFYTLIDDHVKILYNIGLEHVLHE